MAKGEQISLDHEAAVRQDRPTVEGIAAPELRADVRNRVDRTARAVLTIEQSPDSEHGFEILQGIVAGAKRVKVKESAMQDASVSEFLKNEYWLPGYREKIGTKEEKNAAAAKRYEQGKQDLASYYFYFGSEGNQQNVDTLRDGMFKAREQELYGPQEVSPEEAQSAEDAIQEMRFQLTANSLMNLSEQIQQRDIPHKQYFEVTTVAEAALWHRLVQVDQGVGIDSVERNLRAYAETMEIEPNSLAVKEGLKEVLGKVRARKQRFGKTQGDIDRTIIRVLEDFSGRLATEKT